MEKLKSMEQYEQLKQNAERVIFMFTAGWCPDCVVIEPILPGLVADFPEYEFIEVNRDEFLDLCSELDIFGIPSFVGFHNGNEVGRFVSKNRKTKEEIEEFLNGLSK